MAKYLIQASYTVEGVRGLLKEGGSKRREAVQQALRSVGGKLEAFYFAFGDTDVFLIVDMPDNVSTAALSLLVCSTGTVNTKTTVLLTPGEIDEAVKKGARFRPAGQQRAVGQR